MVQCDMLIQVGAYPIIYKRSHMHLTFTAWEGAYCSTFSFMVAVSVRQGRHSM